MGQLRLFCTKHASYSMREISRPDPYRDDLSNSVTMCEMCSAPSKKKSHYRPAVVKRLTSRRLGLEVAVLNPIASGQFPHLAPLFCPQLLSWD